MYYTCICIQLYNVVSTYTVHELVHVYTCSSVQWSECMYMYMYMNLYVSLIQSSEYYVHITYKYMHA